MLAGGESLPTPTANAVPISFELVNCLAMNDLLTKTRQFLEENVERQVYCNQTYVGASF